eukprot:COSAG01_NODE_12933_length_1661_cov_1.076825_3_plen_85_part_00
MAHLPAGRSTSTSTSTRSDLASTGAVMAAGDASLHSHCVFRLLLSVLPATIRRAAAALRSRPWHRVAFCSCSQQAASQAAGARI